MVFKFLSLKREKNKGKNEIDDVNDFLILDRDFFFKFFCDVVISNRCEDVLNGKGFWVGLFEGKIMFCELKYFIVIKLMLGFCL